MDHIVKRGACSCAELHVFSCYRGWEGAWNWRAPFQKHRDACFHYVSFLKANMPKENHAILKESLREYGTLYATVKNWVVQFKRGVFSKWVASCPGRHKTVTTPKTIEYIHELNLEDHRISTKINSWSTGHFTRVDCVHHSWRLRQAEALLELRPEMPGLGLKTSVVPVVWTNFGNLSARSK